MNEVLNETLADEVKSENPRTAAARQAKAMGLTYAGFGRYLDSKGNVSHVVHDGRLVPFKGIEGVQKMYDKADNAATDEKYKELKAKADEHSKVYKTRQKEDEKILRSKSRDVKKVNKSLNQLYSPDLFDDNQLDAIYEYTDNFYDSVNRYLYKGHDEGVDAKRDSDIVNMINTLDSMFDQVEAPFSYTVYTGLSGRYKAEKLKAGEQYLFRGYLSTSLDPIVASSGYTDAEKNGRVLLQIEVQEGQKALHIDGVSSKEGEMETLLPRGSTIEIVSGPHPLDPSVLDPDMGDMYGGVSLFHCVIVEEQ